jgi:hypothetical protein
MPVLKKTPAASRQPPVLKELQAASHKLQVASAKS